MVAAAEDEPRVRVRSELTFVEVKPKGADVRQLSGIFAKIAALHGAVT
jgi:hypothetical protein